MTCPRKSYRADDPAIGPASRKPIGNALLAVFLAGGALGGVLFGMFADRWGRKPVMVVTILFILFLPG